MLKYLGTKRSPVPLSILIFLMILLNGCASKQTIVDNRAHLFRSKEIGVEITFSPQWHLSNAANSLFVAELKPTGTPIVRLTATDEKNIPSLEDYLKLEPSIPLSQRVQKLSQNKISYLQALSSRKIKVNGETWGESVWLGQREGITKIFHTYTASARLNLVQLHFEFPSTFYENQKEIIAAVLDGVSFLPLPEPSDEEYVRAYRSIGEIYKGRGQWSDAIEAFQNALSKNPQEPELHILLGESHLKNDAIDPALQSFLKATQLSSQNARAYEGLADVYFKQGSTDQGIAAIKRAVGLAPQNPGLYLKLGEAYLKQGRTQEAINTYQKLLRRKFDTADAHLGLAKAYLNVDLYEQAILELEQTVKLRPQQVEPHCLLEKAYTHLESTADAEREKQLCKQGTSETP
ncbi:MAG: tetratricopeptide repeat protein [Nitrospirae bacterium]|nr:tetratricopeptide repeat protein [Candidatus Manganitrophaceae bacterium]